MGTNKRRKDEELVRVIHDMVLKLSLDAKRTWQAVMGLYAIWGSIIVGAVVAHALGK